MRKLGIGLWACIFVNVCVFGLFSCEIAPNTKVIADRAFEYCHVLTRVDMPNSVSFIGVSVFWCCYDLSSVTFNGAQAEWNAIEKGSAWNYGIPATKVVCMDGEVAL